MKYCVVYRDPKRPSGMGLVVDLDDPTPAMRYAWSNSPSIITAFDSEEDARTHGIEKCGIGEYHNGVKLLTVQSHPSKKYHDLRKLPALKL